MSRDPGRLALLTVAEMARADSAAIAAGIAASALMEAAGRAVAAAAMQRFTARPTIVLCGPGNNGGDGFVAARHLAAAGWPVRVALLGNPGAIKVLHAAGWTGPVDRLEPLALGDAALAIDAIFGAGLSRPLGGAVLATVEELARRRLPTIAVDVPSGVDGDTGAVRGHAVPAVVTVTFFRKKPGHLLLPGRLLCGEVVVEDIGIPERVLGDIAPAAFENDPDLWLDRMPWPKADGHKYDRGHALVVGGATLTGAARLAAEAARRAGAGLLTIVSPAEAVTIYRLAQPGHLVRTLGADGAIPDTLLADPRVTAVLIGPGGGVGEATRRHVEAALGAGKPCVIDADGLTSFADRAEDLAAILSADCVLTPHAGEYARLFASGGDTLSRARSGAKVSGAVLLLKGPDTVIASPGGRVAINANAPPELATGGTGDVLAGLVLGLLAQRMPAFTAAAAAAWIHGEAGRLAGPGLIAEDLAPLLPQVLRRLKLRGASGRP